MKSEGLPFLENLPRMTSRWTQKQRCPCKESLKCKWRRYNRRGYAIIVTINGMSSMKVKLQTLLDGCSIHFKGERWEFYVGSYEESGCPSRRAKWEIIRDFSLCFNQKYKSSPEIFGVSSLNSKEPNWPCQPPTTRIWMAKEKSWIKVLCITYDLMLVKDQKYGWSGCP